MNDVIRLAMIRACEAFDGKCGGLFNAAGFAHALTRIAGTNGTIDGLVVQAILCGRDDVVMLQDGAHYEMALTKGEREV